MSPMGDSIVFLPCLQMLVDHRAWIENTYIIDCQVSFLKAKLPFSFRQFHLQLFLFNSSQVATNFASLKP